MNGESIDIKQTRLQRLKGLFPELFAESQLDWEKLKAAFGDDINFANERYVLNWAGKSDAFKILQQPTTATLKPAPEESVNFDTTENLFIEGENLEALKVLQKAYYGKVKCIIIDPPYNTGSDSFIYPDKFSEKKEDYLKRIGDKDEEGFLMKEGLFRKNSKDSGHYHSNWLSMMYPRLFLAKNLLRDDGVIFVHIDDNEVHNLRMVMNEIYGEENFISCIIWKKKHSYGRGHTYIIPQTEYILCFAKSINSTNSFGLEYSEDKMTEFDEEDEKGRYRLLRLWHTAPRGGYSRPTLQYQLFTPGGELVDSVSGQWLWSEDRIKKEIEANNVVFVKQKDSTIRAFKKDYLQEGRTEKPTSFYDKATTDDAAKEFNSLLPDVQESFFTKPSKLILDLISWTTIQAPKNNDIILDFFAGSGTTAHAVLELNKEDGGNRRFILVQMPEPCDENSEAYKAGYKTIADIGKERIRRVIKKIENTDTPHPDTLPQGERGLFPMTGDTPLIPPPLTGGGEGEGGNKYVLGFKVFKLSPSNFKIWRGSEIDSEEKLMQQLDAFTNPIRPGAEKQNMLYELMLKAGYELTSPVQYVIASGAKQSQGKEIASGSANPRNDSAGFYSINDNELIIALDAMNEKLIEQIIAARPQKVITLDSLFTGNDQLKTNTVLQMRDAGIDFKTI